MMRHKFEEPPEDDPPQHSSQEYDIYSVIDRSDSIKIEPTIAIEGDAATSKGLNAYIRTRNAYKHH